MAGIDEGSLDLQSMKFDERYKVFRAYYAPQVHNVDFYELRIKETYAIVSFAINSEASETFCEKNISGTHAEVLVIRKLEAAVSRSRGSTSITQLRVEIYLNYSPCDEKGCCKALIKFKADQRKKIEKVNMKVIFANLYNVNRPRCVADNCQHHLSHPVGSRVDIQNQKGLQALNNANIRLRTFTTDDWNFVANALSVAKRDVEDKRVREDLDEILSSEGQ